MTVRYKHGDACFSDCGRYRFWLKRRWDYGRDELPIVMLNPSEAGAHADDPTIRRCVGFAAREGYGGIVVSNLFSLVATDPRDLMKAHDPVGLETVRYLRAMFEASAARPILVAWGASRIAEGRAEPLIHKFGHRMVCLGVTKNGAPRHPLYLAKDTPMVGLLAARAGR
ncbi:MAG: DUF1643 domain-containing protein [Paracoccaceae bacterium]